MKVALDVQYDEEADSARAAAVVFQEWADPRAYQCKVEDIEGLQPYEPGNFYKRELPCILPLVIWARQNWEIDTILVDGYVDLGERPGLGRHLFQTLGADLVVAGVAKSMFQGATPVTVFRGGSARPLYVTATEDVDSIARGVRRMAGAFRMPNLLTKVDQLARGRA
jgi:deoxyribonuclease V